MRMLNLVVAVSCLALAIGCGEKSESGFDGKLSSSASVSNAGWQMAESKGSGISLEVPPSWQILDLTAEDFSKVIDAMTRENPNMAAMAPQVKGLAASGKFKMFVFDNDEAKQGTFASNVNVLVEDMPPGATPAQIMEGVKAGMKQLTVGGEPKYSDVSLPAGEAHQFEGSMEFPAPNGGKYVTYTSGYMFFRGDKVITITFTSLKDKEETARPLFKKMAETIKFS